MIYYHPIFTKWAGDMRIVKVQKNSLVNNFDKYNNSLYLYKI